MNDAAKLVTMLTESVSIRYIFWFVLKNYFLLVYNNNGQLPVAIKQQDVSF
jgi:hypothetical protein